MIVRDLSYAETTGQVKPYRGPPMTLGNAAAAASGWSSGAGIVWCKACQRRSSPTPPRWLLGRATKSPCSIGANGWFAPRCGSRQAEMVLSGTRRQTDRFHWQPLTARG